MGKVFNKTNPPLSPFFKGGCKRDFGWGDAVMKKLKLFAILLLLTTVFYGCAGAPAKAPDVPKAALLSKASDSSKAATRPELSPALSNPSVHEVGFDIDDTILFSSPAFDKAYAGAEPYTEDFWKIVNASDGKVSHFKKKTVEILKAHQKKGHKIYLITSRNPAGGEALKKFLAGRLVIPEENILFSPSGKTELIKELGIDAFYGDSDSDMRCANEAGAMPLRIKRSPESGYKASYNPGCLDEYIIPDSE